jgi:hypothetical protein
MVVLWPGGSQVCATTYAEMGQRLIRLDWTATVRGLGAIDTNPTDERGFRRITSPLRPYGGYNRLRCRASA